jgi:hypothetical protein
MTDTSQDTLAKETDSKSLQDIKRVMKDGEEPTEMLLSLVSSPLIDLKGRELAKVITAKEGDRDVVLAIFYDTTWIDGKGIVGKKELAK